MLHPQRDELFAGLLNRLQLCGPVAEIGVDRGNFARETLRRWTGRGPYYAVDYWPVSARSSFETYGDRSAARAEVSHLGKIDPRLRVIDAESERAAKSIPAASLDAVYIDAGHSFTDVTRDLAIWYERVRDGGIVAGHDYIFSTHFHPQLAVDLFCKRIGTVARFNDEQFPTWWFFKGRSQKTIGVTAFTPDWPAKEFVRQNRSDHAKASGSQWIVEEYGAMGRPEACWKKLELVRDVCRANPGAWVLWLDADAVVTDLSKPLSALVGASPYDMILPIDPIGNCVNSGAFAVRANAFGPIYEQWVAENPAYWYTASPYENGALIDLMARGALPNVEVVNHRLCNSLPAYGLWGASDLVAHFPGQSNRVGPTAAEHMTFPDTPHHMAGMVREYAAIARALHKPTAPEFA